MRKDKIKFIRTSVPFLIILAILVMIINYGYINLILHKKTDYRSEEQYSKWLATDDRVLEYGMFGDSHLKDGLNPMFIEDSFNFATDAENYLETYYKLRRIIEDDGVRIKNVIFLIDMQSSSNWYEMTNLELWTRWIPYREIMKVRNESLVHLWIEANFPFVVAKGDEVVFLFSNSSISPMYKGWVNKTNDFSKSDMAFIADRKVREQFENQSRFDEVIMDYFRKTLRLAKDNGINIYFISLPVSKAYDERRIYYNVSRDDYYGRIFAEIENIVGEDYHYFDFYYLFMDRPELFHDSDHLNYKGADILSKKLNEELKKD